MGGPGSGRKKGGGKSNSKKLGMMKEKFYIPKKAVTKIGLARGSKNSKISAKVSTSRKLGGKSFKSSKMGKEYKSDSKFRV